ncbi:rod shape-determining protein MreD [Lederbergia citri]|uniref:Rod shape-determining protein MreD n=1 Tax=Lederbergia citri TaxID=2833580 RepID=A0A942YGL6_9BACI|nr:rod shape-determining protein MreD [Lederbergia citri]MBS4194824.1 rod shape-determining protein MreD [Lederbergia citri]
MKRWILPFLLTLTFYFESVFVEFLPEKIFGQEWILVPRFLIILLMIMGISYFRNRTLIYAAVFGLLFDIYFNEIIGVYLVLFPIGVYISSKLMKYIFANFFTVFLLSMISLSFIEILIYGMNILVLRKHMIFDEFVMIRLVPTLILNAIFLIIIYFPFNRFLMNLKKEEMNE